jgi:hypothetical protein
MSDKTSGFTAAGAPTTTTPLQQAQLRRRGVLAALIELEQAIASPSTGREQAWIGRVAEQLADLKTAFGYHVSVTEEPAGLFDEVLSQAPRLSHQVDSLRADHVRLMQAIDAALDSARAPDAQGHVSHLTEAGSDLLARLTRHRNLGSTMVHEAYLVDIDAAD